MSVYEKAKQRRLDAPHWKKILTKELLKPKLKRFPRRVVHPLAVNRIWTADLVDLQKYSRQNKGFKYILVVLDIFSRYAWARALKDKTGVSVKNAFQDIISDGSKPSKLWTDKGTEFYNTQMQKFLKNNDIELYSTHNEPKAMIAERFIRTLRRMIESNYVLTNSTVWYDILPQLIHEYNTKKHRALKMSPEAATKPENAIQVIKLQKTGSKVLQKFKIGDKVRISVVKRVFSKEASANWSEEIFEVYEVVNTRPVTYRLKDLLGEKIEGSFYNEQLQKTNQEIYRVEKVLRKRSKKDGTQEFFVRWAGYPDKFNQWLPAADVFQSRVAFQNMS